MLDPSLRHEQFVAAASQLFGSLSASTLDEIEPLAEWRQLIALRLEVADSGLVGLDVAEGRLSDVVFSGCKLDYANFRFVKAERVTFRDCSMVDADFQDAELTEVAFAGCDLTRARFVRAKLAAVDLRTSTLESIERATDLKGAKISTGQLMALAPFLASGMGITVDDD